MSRRRSSQSTGRRAPGRDGQGRRGRCRVVQHRPGDVRPGGQGDRAGLPARDRPGPARHAGRVEVRRPGGAAGCAQRAVGRGVGDRRLHPAQPREDARRPRDRRRQPDRRHPAGHLQRRPVPAGRRARAVLPARPVELGVLLDRRQRLDQLRRPLLRQVRRHHRLRARARGRDGRRRDPADRPSHRQRVSPGTT